MQYTGTERELPGSPLKNTTNDAAYASRHKESPMRSPGSHSKNRKLVKSKTTGSNGSLQGYSPSPVKKQAENSNEQYSSPKGKLSSNKKVPRSNTRPHGTPVEIIKGKCSSKSVVKLTGDSAKVCAYDADLRVLFD